MEDGRKRLGEGDMLSFASCLKSQKKKKVCLHLPYGSASGLSDLLFLLSKSSYSLSRIPMPTWLCPAQF